MFSASGASVVIRTGSRSAAAPRVAATTAAAPAMSLRISFIAGTGLIEMPPVSKVMPLPISTTWVRASAGCQSSSTSRGPLAEPPPTARIPPKPSAASSSGPRTRSRRSGRSAAAEATCSANHCGFFSELGVLVRSRARWVIAAVVWAVATMASNAPGSAEQQIDAAERRCGRRPRSCRNRYGASSSPSVNPRTAAGVTSAGNAMVICDLIRSGAGQGRASRPPGRLVAVTDAEQQQPAGSTPGAELGVDLTGPSAQSGRRHQRGGLVGRAVRGCHGGRDGLGRGVTSRCRIGGANRQDEHVEPVGLGDQTDGEHAGPYLQESVAERNRARLPALMKTLSHRRYRWLRVARTLRAA